MRVLPLAMLGAVAAVVASTVQVNVEGAANPDVDAVITTIGELPKALMTLASR